ncbi:unnamed protein product [Phytophthora fragariaefolia]|uniref:Unnamed protein product n=1 Tax=Phytophthora fragariaefolia TaxID=1490495 RepID=A0A9W6X6G8_9STRA|nr:unnamed protein product [Phytophthora fragariaefolia]
MRTTNVSARPGPTPTVRMTPSATTLREPADVAMASMSSQSTPRSKRQTRGQDEDSEDLLDPETGTPGIAAAVSAAMAVMGLTRVRLCAFSELKQFHGRDASEKKARAGFNRVKSGSRRDGMTGEAVCALFGELMAGPARQCYLQLSKNRARREAGSDDAGRDRPRCRHLLLLDTGARVSILDTTFTREIGCLIDTDVTQNCVGIRDETYYTVGRTRVKITLARNLVYFMDLWVGDLVGQHAILGMNFMVPAGVRIDTADGTACLLDEVRIQLIGRRPLYGAKMRPISVASPLRIDPGRTRDIPLRPDRAAPLL